MADRPENTAGLPSNPCPDREDNLSSYGNDATGNVDDADEEQQDVDPPVFDRSPPPELEEHLRVPLAGLNPNVLGVGGMQNFVARGHAHMWGEGVRLGAVQHNPHVIDPVLRAQTPGESAVRRLEMRQQQQLQPEAGIERVLIIVIHRAMLPREMQDSPLFKLVKFTPLDQSFKGWIMLSTG